MQRACQWLGSSILPVGVSGFDPRRIYGMTEQIKQKEFLSTLAQEPHGGPSRAARQWTRTRSRKEFFLFYRLDHCGLFRAFLRPNFFRSTARASRVSIPAFFKAPRSFPS